MKHKRSLMSIAMATLVVVSLCAVGVSAAVSAAPSSSANVSDGLVGAPAGIVGAPAVSSWAPYGISEMLFVRGTDNALWERSYDQIESIWGPWTSLGGGITSAPAVASCSATFMQVYARGNDGSLWSRWTNDGAATWTPWYKPLPAGLLAGTGAAVCAESSTGLAQDLFVTGTSGALYWSHWTNTVGYSSWTNLGGKLTASPGAASYGSSPIFIQVYGRGGDGGLWSRWTGNGGTSWTPWYKPLTAGLLAGTGPAVCVLSSGKQDLFVTGTNGAVWWSHWDVTKGYTAFTSVGGGTTASPAATVMAGGIQLWVRGNDGGPWSNGYYSDINGQWSWLGWHRLA